MNPWIVVDRRQTTRSTIDEGMMLEYSSQVGVGGLKIGCGSLPSLVTT
jgi:hypothetical protein